MKIWLKDQTEIEEKALEQAVHLASLPLRVTNVALMPDVHAGFGVPIGTVFAAMDAILPNAVGFDIGCGVTAVMTDRKTQELISGRLQTVLRDIYTIVDNQWHELAMNSSLEKDIPALTAIGINRKSKKTNSLLGGGNHFVELQKDEEDNLWFMIHTGAGDLPERIADYYLEIAKRYCKDNQLTPPTVELSFLPLETSEAQGYIHSVKYCTLIAAQFRRRLADRILDYLSSAPHEIMDAPHNFLAQEQHFGRNLLVHRKGAIRAEVNTRLPIPGSMGQPSYIARGLGNPESFCSCSHGAGRRTDGASQLNRTPEQIISELFNQGIEILTNKPDELTKRSYHDYKDITEVMTRQGDLIKIEKKLTPIGVARG